MFSERLAGSFLGLSVLSKAFSLPSASLLPLFVGPTLVGQRLEIRNGKGPKGHCPEKPLVAFHRLSQLKSPSTMLSRGPEPGWLCRWPAFTERERAQGRLVWGRVTRAFTQGHCAQWRDLSGPKWKKAGNAKASDNRKSQNTTNPKGQEKIRGGGFSWENYITPWTAVGQKALALLKERSQSFLFCVWVQITPSSPQQQQGAPSLYWLARMRGLDHCTAACCFISTKWLFFFLLWLLIF